MVIWNFRVWWDFDEVLSFYLNMDIYFFLDKVICFSVFYIKNINEGNFFYIKVYLKDGFKGGYYWV